MRGMEVSCRALLVIQSSSSVCLRLCLCVCADERNTCTKISMNNETTTPYDANVPRKWTEIVQPFQWFWGSWVWCLMCACVFVTASTNMTYRHIPCARQRNSRWHLDFNAIFHHRQPTNKAPLRWLNYNKTNEATKRRKKCRSVENIFFSPEFFFFFFGKLGIE